MEVTDKKRLLELFSSFLNTELVQITFGNPVDEEQMKKAKARPVLVKDQLEIQAEEFVGKQAFHKNLKAGQAADYLTGLLEKQFRQCELQAENGWAQVLVSKKGKVTIKQKGACSRQVKMLNTAASSSRSLSHNRSKRYVLEEGVPVPFLIDLGVMTADGKIVAKRYDKFRQINRFLEFIEDILPKLSTDRENTIIDFGCGKSYLTFAMYYFLKELRGYQVRIIGLDLKEDVIDHCSRLSKKYGYEGLTFTCGDIAGFEGVDQVDMVVTLHACDTATDYALAKAVHWGAKVILSVPCCQHELNGQMENELLKPVLHYGILKERMAALFTDGIRAELLEQVGYRTQILEFIDMEHTPKNLLIRAVWSGKKKENQTELQSMLDALQVKPTLAGLLECEKTEKEEQA